MAKNSVVKNDTVDSTELVYSKRVIVEYYSRHADYLQVVLADDRLYTNDEIELILKEVQ